MKYTFSENIQGFLVTGNSYSTLTKKNSIFYSAKNEV